MEIFKYFATTAKGVEDVLAGELRALGIRDIKVETGGVRFSGTIADCYRANLWLRTANRVLVHLAEFPCTSPEELYDGIRPLPWTTYLTPDMTLAVDCNVRDCAITHSKYAALKTKDAVVDAVRERYGRRPNVDTSDPDLRINVHLFRNRCTVSLDSSGIPLDRRGYRLARQEAPLRETLASAMVHLSGWDGTVPFFDPMCGSGTIPIEAAQLAVRRAPGLERSFGFLRWTNHDPNLWHQVVAQAREQLLDTLSAPIIGSDVSTAALASAHQNCLRAGVAPFITWHRQDMSAMTPPEQPGIIVFNPPYGQRLGDTEELKALYRRIGDFLKQRCKGWTAFILVGDMELAKFVGLKAARRIVLFNGPIECRLLKYEMY